MASDRIQKLVTALMLPASEAQLAQWRREGGRFVDLTLSSPPPTDPEGSERVTAKVTVTGRRVTFLVEGHVHVLLDMASGEVEIQFKARALWALGGGVRGYGELGRFWLWELSGLLLGGSSSCREIMELSGGDLFRDHPKGGASIAAVLGWRTTGIEVCVDFVGVEWSLQDLENFVGVRGTGGQRGGESDGYLFKGTGGDVETVNIGSRSSDVMIQLYNKSEQKRRTDRGDVSTYASAWRARGYSEDRHGDVQRVELRLSGKGLKLRNTETGRELNFRDPARVADAKAIATAWAWAMEKKRLTLPDTATRKERRKTDPRWLPIQAAAENADLEGLRDWRQDRTVQEEAHVVALARAARDAERGLLRYAALHNQQVDDEILEVASQPDDAVTTPEAAKARDVALGKAEQHVHASMMGAAARIIANTDTSAAATYQRNHGAKWRAQLGEPMRAAGRRWCASMETAPQRLAAANRKHRKLGVA
ncbi:MAG: hypothetical protein GY910_02985 [bacterium]|nr:hypothetical protein [bacterium]